MNDTQNSLIDTAVRNFFQASNQVSDPGSVLGTVFLGLMQVANAVANQVSDSAAQGLAQTAGHNFNAQSFAVGSSVTLDDVQMLALGLQQLAAAMKALN
jgi:hypothetical protein